MLLKANRLGYNPSQFGDETDYLNAPWVYIRTCMRHVYKYCNCLANLLLASICPNLSMLHVSDTRLDMCSLCANVCYTCAEQLIAHIVQISLSYTHLAHIAEPACVQLWKQHMCSMYTAAMCFCKGILMHSPKLSGCPTLKLWSSSMCWNRTSLLPQKFSLQNRHLWVKLMSALSCCCKSRTPSCRGTLHVKGLFWHNRTHTLSSAGLVQKA